MKKSIIALAVAGAMNASLISQAPRERFHIENNREPYKGKGKQRMKKLT